jgi:hypothetical protein
LKSVNIPNSVTSIRDSAFDGCNELTRIAIPDSVASIGDSAFKSTSWYDNQPDGLIYAGKVAYHYEGVIPDNTTIVLKPGTKGIAGEAFETDLVDTDNPGLIGVSIPNTVTNIGDSAFFGCTGLKNVIIPKSVVSIGEEAFGYYIRIEYAEKFPGFTIRCFANSAGLKYARENGFAYKILPASAASTDPTATTGPVITTINGSTVTTAASTAGSSSTGNRLTLPAIILAVVVFSALVAIAVLIIVKKKKGNTGDGSNI